MAGLVPAVPLEVRHCVPQRDRRDFVYEDGASHLLPGDDDKSYYAARNVRSRWMISLASRRYAWLPTHLRS